MDFRSRSEKEADARNAANAQLAEQADYKRRFETLVGTVQAQQEEITRLLAEARETNERTQMIVARLREHFDAAMDYNKQTMESLQTMYGTVMDANQGFLNQPTQDISSTANVAEMLRLLELLSQDQGAKVTDE